MKKEMCYIDWSEENAPTIRRWHGEPVKDINTFQICKETLEAYASQMCLWWAGFYAGVKRKTMADVHDWPQTLFPL